MAGFFLPLGLCKETVSGIWKTVEISSDKLRIHCDWGNLNFYLDHPPIGGYVSYPTVIPDATRLGLRSSLYTLGAIAGTTKQEPYHSGQITWRELRLHLGNVS